MTGRKPLIGIWWDNGRKTVALPHEVDVNSSGGDLVDSDLRQPMKNGQGRIWF